MQDVFVTLWNTALTIWHWICKKLCDVPCLTNFSSLQDVGISHSEDSDESEDSDSDNFSVEFEVESVDSDAYSEDDDDSVPGEDEVSALNSVVPLKLSKIPHIWKITIYIFEGRKAISHLNVNVAV